MNEFTRFMGGVQSTAGLTKDMDSPAAYWRRANQGAKTKPQTKLLT
jgi:hypothetical protein